MAAGKAMRLGNAYVTLRVLRDHMHSNLPVEIWYLGTEEMDVATKAGLEVTRSLSHSPLPCPIWQHTYGMPIACGSTRAWPLGERCKYQNL